MQLKGIVQAHRSDFVQPDVHFTGTKEGVKTPRAHFVQTSNTQKESLGEH